MESLENVTPQIPGPGKENVSPVKAVDSATKVADRILHALAGAPQGAQQVAPLSEYGATRCPRSGIFWEYIPPPKPNKDGGFIHEFCLKKEFDDIASSEGKKAFDKRTREIFPAVEPSGLDACALLPTGAHVTSEQKVLEELGYGFEVKKNEVGELRVYIYVPDEKALLANWKKMKEAHPHLPDLKIGSGEGIADDMAFVAAYLVCDVLLSRNAEFIHDSMVHVIPTVLAMQLPGYSEWRLKVNQVIEKAKQRIETVEKMITDRKIAPGHPVSEHLDKMKTALGAYVDITSGDSLALVKSGEVIDMQHHFKSIWNEWPTTYWEKKFGGKNLDYPVLATVWEMIEKITD